MGTTPIRLIRFCAALALFLSFAHFIVLLADWAAPVRRSNGWWVGKRVSEVVNPNQPVAPVQKLTPGRLTDFTRYEIGNLFTALSGPSTWFCLAASCTC